MFEILVSTITGMIVGAVFALVKLPIPAPPTFASLMGVVGIFLGYIIVKYFGGM